MQSLNRLIYEVITQQKGKSVVASKHYFVCVRYVQNTTHEYINLTTLNMLYPIYVLSDLSEFILVLSKNKKKYIIDTECYNVLSYK